MPASFENALFSPSPRASRHCRQISKIFHPAFSRTRAEFLPSDSPGDVALCFFRETIGESAPEYESENEFSRLLRVKKLAGNFNLDSRFTVGTTKVGASEKLSRKNLIHFGLSFELNFFAKLRPWQRDSRFSFLFFF